MCAANKGAIMKYNSTYYYRVISIDATTVGVDEVLKVHSVVVLCFTKTDISYVYLRTQTIY